MGIHPLRCFYFLEKFLVQSWVACCGNVSLWTVVVAGSQHLRKANLYQECLFQKGRDLIELICNKLLPGPPKRIQRISLDFVDNLYHI